MESSESTPTPAPAQHFVRMNIESVVVGGPFVPSIITLKPDAHDALALEEQQHTKLPIRIGPIEATSITMGIDPSKQARPLAHDMIVNLVELANMSVVDVRIVRVEGTTFYAYVRIQLEGGDIIQVNARPSDAISVAVRCGAPLFCAQEVLKQAGLPDFDTVEKEVQQEQLEQFKASLDDLNPDDFMSDTNN